MINTVLDFWNLLYLRFHEECFKLQVSCDLLKFHFVSFQKVASHGALHSLSRVQLKGEPETAYKILTSNHTLVYHTLTLKERITCLVIEEFVYNKTIRKSLNNGAQYVYIIEYKTGVHREFTHDWVWAGLRVTLHTRYLRLMVPQWVISTFRPKQKNIYISDRCNSSSYFDCKWFIVWV